jgi:hypothetical protein
MKPRTGTIGKKAPTPGRQARSYVSGRNASVMFTSLVPLEAIGKYSSSYVAFVYVINLSSWMNFSSLCKCTLFSSFYSPIIDPIC